MDPAWVAVVGTTVAAVGASAAAVVTGWSNRRQVDVQVAGTEEQWQREKRCDVYSAFLVAGVHARDELAAVLRSMRSPGRDPAAIRAHLDTTAPLVQKVRHSCATVFVLGPDAVLIPARRAEEAVVLLQRFLWATLESLESEQGPRPSRDIGTRLNSQIHASLDEFTAATRKALGDAAPPPKDKRSEPLRIDFDTELQWLLSLMSSEVGTAVADIDPTLTLFDYGLDSLGLVGFFHRAEIAFDLRPGSLWTINAMYRLSVEEVAKLIATERTARP
ncbi:acyl carrier protein [Nocardia sp. NPDC001965]